MEGAILEDSVHIVNVIIAYWNRTWSRIFFNNCFQTGWCSALKMLSHKFHDIGEQSIDQEKMGNV